MRIFVTLCLAAAAAWAADYAIATSGNDTTGDGSPAKPWATLGKAIASTTGDSAATYRLGAGTFTTTGTTTLRSGMSIIGAGRDSTVLIADLSARGTYAYDTYCYLTATTIVGITVSDLTLAGAADDVATRRSRALAAYDGTDLTLLRLRMIRYQDGALHLERWKRLLVDSCVIEKVTYNTYFQNGLTPATQSTAIEVADLEDAKFLRLTIDTRERGGRAIGTDKQKWLETTDSYNWEPAAMVRVEFAYNSIDTDRFHAWSTGTGAHPPQTNVELWRAYCDTVRLHHNRFNGNLSMTCDTYTRYGTFQPPYGNPAKPVPDLTMEVDHNLFDLIPTGQVYTYAFETYVPKLQFHHNVVFRGIYPFAAWGQGDQNDTSIHHNVFYGTGNSTGLFRNQLETPNLRFVNNTVYATNTQTSPMVELTRPRKDANGNFILDANGQKTYENYQAPNQIVANNLFLSTVSQTQPVGFTVGCSYNWVWRFANVGTPVGTGDPSLFSPPPTELLTSGGFDWTRMRLAAGSPAIDQGIVVSPETNGYAGSAPDLGAFESGTTPWVVGPQNAPVIQPAAAATPAQVALP
jgi:hypothetical protein